MTKIVGTLGPNSRSVEVISGCLKAGMSGNLFSSLAGLQFMWLLTPETYEFSHSLVHVPLKDLPLSGCWDIQLQLEKDNVFSDVYVVKGIEIGRQIVTAYMLEPSAGRLADNTVLIVVESMLLSPPSPVHVLIGAVVHYTLKVIRNNDSQVVSLPSPFYQWSILNNSVARVDRAMGTVHALNLGVNTVAVKDTRVAGHVLISSLHVVLPDHLLLFFSPLSSSRDQIEGIEPIACGSRWYVVAGRQYLILVKVFSPGPGAEEIFITESDEINFHGKEEEFWSILTLSEGVAAKNNYGILYAKSYGLGKITTTLACMIAPDTKKEVLRSFQEIMVCDEVQFNIGGHDSISNNVLLPWVPGVNQELELRASGGCSMSSSDYKWFSSDTTVVSISDSGIVHANKPGKATITAVSIFDELNFDKVVIEVSVPHSMVILPNFPVETNVGSNIQAYVTLKASTGSYFYACNAFKSFIKWKTDSDHFIIHITTMEEFAPDNKKADELHDISHGPPCSWTNLYAVSTGQTLVHATLTMSRDDELSDDTSLESPVLKASSSIAAFLPLIVHQGSDGNPFGGYCFDWVHAESEDQLRSLHYLYLVPGTYLDVMLRGGPERWGKDVEFIDTFEILADKDALLNEGVWVHQMSTSYGNPYRIGCESLGTFKLIFRRGNLMGEGHHLPVVSEVQLMLVCSFPSSMVIIADEARNDPQAIQAAAMAERLPGRIRASPINVANGRKIRVSAVGLSDSGKAFANSSSLFLSWELADCEAGLVLLDETDSSAVYSTWERFLILQNTSGLCTVRSTAVSIHSRGDIETSKTTLTDAIQLQLVSTLRVSPEFRLLLFSSQISMNISIDGGRCFLDALVMNDTNPHAVISVGPQLHPHPHPQNTVIHQGDTLNRLSVDAPREVLTNVPLPPNGYAFSVRFPGGGKVHLPFHCTTTPSEIGLANAWKDPKTGETFCLFFPYLPGNIALDSPHRVMVSIRATLGEDNRISGSADALFVGGFALDKQHLRFTKDSHIIDVITITGNTDGVQLNWFYKTDVMARIIHGDNSSIAKCEVFMFAKRRFRDELIFSLPETGQTTEVTVSYDDEPSNLSIFLDGAMVIVLGICTIVLVYWLVYWLEQPEQPEQPEQRDI